MTVADWAIFSVGVVAAVAAVLGARWARRAAGNTEKWQQRQSRPVPVINVTRFPVVRAGIYNAGGGAVDCLAFIHVGRHVYIFRGPVPANLSPVPARLTWAGTGRHRRRGAPVVVIAIDLAGVWWDCIEGIVLPKAHADWLTAQLKAASIDHLIRAEPAGNGVRIVPTYKPTTADRIRYRVMSVIVFDTPPPIPDLRERSTSTEVDRKAN